MIEMDRLENASSRSGISFLYSSLDNISRMSWALGNRNTVKI